MIVLVAVLAYVALPILVSTGAGLFVFDSFGFLAHAALPVRFAACKLSLPTQWTARLTLHSLLLPLEVRRFCTDVVHAVAQWFVQVRKINRVN